MDAVTLDHLIGELEPVLVGRHLERVRLAGPHALTVEVSGGRGTLWLEAGKRAAGLYLLKRDEARSLAGRGQDEEAPGRTRQALLRWRKHLDGVRVTGLGRVPGTRTLLLQAGHCTVTLRLSGSAPALALAVEGIEAAGLGEGPSSWPPPPPAPDREWDTVDPTLLEAAVEEAAARGLSVARAMQAACPGLGPLLARQLHGDRATLAALRERLVRPRPTLVLPTPLEDLRDVDLAAPGAVALLPFPPMGEGHTVFLPSSWREAAALFLRLRLRGDRFSRRRRKRLEAERRVIRRLARLEAHLARDLSGLGSTSTLRHQAEALLAFGGEASGGATQVEVPDPYDPARELRIALDPKQSLPANADRLFERARRLERARPLLERRLEDARASLAEARAREAALEAARDDRDLAVAPAPDAPPAARAATQRSGPRHYLTTRGLSLLVGRSARENHRVTFEVARPDDLWLHALDAPGAHVVLRDPEGRAAPDDRREAAEVAAFFSDARGQARADVLVTRRKHVRPAGGGPGRVRVSHSETLRVTPRDPEGRLRKR